MHLECGGGTAFQCIADAPADKVGSSGDLTTAESASLSCLIGGLDYFEQTLTRCAMLRVIWGRYPSGKRFPTSKLKDAL
jgi:hypothetical protein